MRKSRALKIALDLVSFNTSQAIAINLALILLVIALLPTPALTYSPFKCVFRNYLLPIVFSGNCPTTGFFAGCKCPACGLTTALSRLLHGDFAGAWAFNKLSFAVLAVMAALIVINLVKSVREYKRTKRIYP